MNNNQNLLLTDGQQKSRRLKQFFILFFVATLITVLITQFVFATAWDDLLGGLLDGLMEILFPPAPKCTVLGCPAQGSYGDHFEGEYYTCKKASTEDWGWGKQLAYNALTLFNANALSAYTFAINLDDDGIMKALWVKATEYYELFAMTGFLILLLYFVMEIIELSTRDGFNLEQLLRMTIKLMIGVVLIINGMEILRALVDLSNDFINDVAGGTDLGASGEQIAETYNAIAPLNDIDAIFYLLGHIWSSLLSFIPLVVYEFLKYSRFIEIVLRASFAPIAMASIYEGGVNSNGMKYLKKFLALCLHGGMMLACITIKTMMVSEEFASGIAVNIASDIIVSLICEIVCISLMIKSRRWAEEIVGV